MKAWTLDLIKANCVTEGNCWIWQAGCKDSGAPVCRHNGKVRTVRRLARELADGKHIPGKREVAAQCGDLRCVSPSCSVKVLTKRRCEMAAANGSFDLPARTAKRMLQQRAASKFSEELIEHARTTVGTCAQIAAATGISLGYVKDIRRGVARRSLANPFAGLLA